MNGKSYTLGPDEKATQVMVGTSDLLVWGDLVTKEQVRISAFLNTLAEEFVPLHDAKMLFLAPAQQMAPMERASLHVKLEEILLFFAMHDTEPPQEETETRRYAPVEVVVGSYQIEGQILKSPYATLQNMLVVAKSPYQPLYQATVRHVAKPWLGTFTSSLVQVRLDRMTMSQR
jgi:hypothetical protein